MVAISLEPVAMSLSVSEWLLVACAGFVMYAYAGYPLIVMALRKLGVHYGPARPSETSTECEGLVSPETSAVCPDADLPALTVIIIVYNAADIIEAKLASVLASDYPAERLQVLVYSDGSTDNIDALLADRADSRVRFIRGTTRRGKAACLNDAVAATNTPLLAFTDARQWLDPQAIRELALHFADPVVGVVSGSLEIGATDSPFDGFGTTDAVVLSAGDYWRLEKRLRAAEADLHSAVGATGALYALRREAFVPIPPETILDDVLIPMNAVLRGYRTLFERRALAFDAPSGSEAQEVQRKIRTLAGSFQLLTLRPALLVPWRNPVWWQFVSHKILRVLAPVALLGLLLTSLWLAPTSPWYLALAGAQILAYAVAVVPGGEGGFWSLRLVQMVRGFVRLQWCAVLGLVWYLRNPSPQLWQTTRHTSGVATPVRGRPGQ